HGGCDPELRGALVGDSFETLRWLHAGGMRWELLFARQSYRAGERVRFWGGLALGVVGGGKGLVESHTHAARARGIEVRYGRPVVGLRQEPDGRIGGVVTHGEAGRAEVEAAAVVLACGGFEADPRFDATTGPLLRADEDRAPGATRLEAGSIAELGAELGLDAEAVGRTVREFNAAVQPGHFDPSVKDGTRTLGIEPPKSNWAR